MATTRGMALTSISKPASFSAYLSGEKVKNKLMHFLPDPTEQKMFIAGLSSAVADNPKLQACEYGSIISAGLKCWAMGFMPGAQTGEAFLTPFGTKCVMIPGYRGYVRLALRSGKVKYIHMGCIREGQTVVQDFLRGMISLEGEPKSPDAPVLGYFAFLELIYGFQKTVFWTKQQAIIHAEKHAKTPFSGALLKKYETFLETGEGLNDKEAKEVENVYYQHFDKMCMKNCLRELLLNWAPLSIRDQQLIATDGESGYTDDEDVVDGEGSIAPYAADKENQENAMPSTKAKRSDPKPQSEILVDATTPSPNDFFGN